MNPTAYVLMILAGGTGAGLLPFVVARFSADRHSTRTAAAIETATEVARVTAAQRADQARRAQSRRMPAICSKESTR